MSAKIELGNIYGLRLTADRTAVIATAALWLLVTLGAMLLLDIPAFAAILGGLICAAGHMLMELFHQIGHAAAARRTGYPMRGVHFWMVLGRSMYSRDEGDLPAAVHIRRALGGPIASALLSAVLGVIALALRPWDATPGWIAAFFFLDSLFVFTLAALLPLGFTDGSTLLKWWGK